MTFFFPDRSRDVAMTTNFSVEIGLSTLFVALAFGNGLQYRHSDFIKFICDDLAILFVNLVNIGPLTPEFNRVVGVHPLI